MNIKNLLALGGFLICAPAAAQTVLNTSVWLPANHTTVADMMVPLCNDIQKVTAGRVKCNILPKAVVAPPQTFDAVKEGVADLSYIVDGYTPGRFILSQVGEFPFLGNSAEVNSIAYQRLYVHTLAKANEHDGVKVLAVFTHGPGQLYNTKRRINSVKDMEGLKIRTGGGLVNDLFKAIGTTPMQTSAPQVYEMLSSGIIDGFVFPKETPLSLKLIPLIKFATFFPGGMYNVTWTVIMNPAKWKSISEADRKAMEPLFGEALARRAGLGWDAADRKGELAMKEAKVDISLASPALIADMKKTSISLEAAWAVRAKTRGVDGRAALKEFRDEIAKLSK